MSEETKDHFVLWRPSFAGSWRPIGEFDSDAEATAYAESKPWKEHGCFTCWEIIRKSLGAPTPTLLPPPIVTPGSTATISSSSVSFHPHAPSF